MGSRLALSVFLEEFLPGKLVNVTPLQIALQMFQVAAYQAGAERATLELDVEKIDQAEMAIWQKQDVAQMQ